MANPVVKAVKEHRNGTGPEPVTLSTGIRAILKPAPAMLITDVQTQIKYPPTPVQKLDDGREVENPMHPDYIQACKEVDEKRRDASIDVMVLFGVELVDGIPKDDTWIVNLRYLEKKGKINLSELDFDDPMDREFAYKKYFVIGNEDAQLLARINGITDQDLDQARESFRGQEERNPN